MLADGIPDENNHPSAVDVAAAVVDCALFPEDVAATVSPKPRCRAAAPPGEGPPPIVGCTMSTLPLLCAALLAGPLLHSALPSGFGGHPIRAP